MQNIVLVWSALMLTMNVMNVMGVVAPVTVTPIVMPPKSSAYWVASADAVIADVRAGTLKGAYDKTNGPAGYGQCFGKINWWNLVTSATVPMFEGQLSPLSPFDNEHGGPVLWNIVIMTSGTGTDDVSLDMLTFDSNSNDNGGILADTVTFTGLTYTPRAIAIKADGTVIDSGSTSQKGRQVIVLICTKLFNGGDTQSGLDAVRTWVAGVSNYSLTYVAMVGGDATTASMTTVSVNGPNPNPVQPRLDITRSGPNGVVKLVEAEYGRQYQLLSRLNADTGMWQPVAILNSTNDVYHMPMTGVSQFYRAMAQ